MAATKLPLTLGLVLTFLPIVGLPKPTSHALASGEAGFSQYGGYRDCEKARACTSRFSDDYLVSDGVNPPKLTNSIHAYSYADWGSGVIKAKLGAMARKYLHKTYGHSLAGQSGELRDQAWKITIPWADSDTVSLVRFKVQVTGLGVGDAAWQDYFQAQLCVLDKLDVYRSGCLFRFGDRTTRYDAGANGGFDNFEFTNNQPRSITMEASFPIKGRFGELDIGVAIASELIMGQAGAWLGASKSEYDVSFSIYPPEGSIIDE